MRSKQTLNIQKNDENAKDDTQCLQENITSNINKSELLYVTRSSNLTIRCPFKSTNASLLWNGPPNLTSYSDNSVVNPAVKDVGIITGREHGEYNLIIYGFVESNEGAYQCSTLNDGQPVLRAFNVKLQIRKPVLSMSISPSKPVIEGSNISVECKATSFPSPYLLTLDGPGGNVLEFNNISDDKMMLRWTKSDIRSNAIGNYTCTAENHFAKGSATVWLNILYPPKVTINGRNYSETESARRLKCIAEGNPDSYKYKQWEHLYNGQHIRYINGLRNGPPLFLRQNLQSHYGKHGDSINIQFYIYSKPEVINVLTTSEKEHVNIEYETEKATRYRYFSQPECSVIGWCYCPEVPSIIGVLPGIKSVNIDWSGGFNGGSQQTFIIQYKQESQVEWFDHINKTDTHETSYTAVIDNLLPNKVYDVRMYAVNSMNRSQFSNVFTVTTRVNVAFNNMYGVNENRQPTVHGATSASVVYSNLSRNENGEALRSDQLPCRPSTSHVMPLNQQLVKHNPLELNYIEIDLDPVPQHRQFYIHGNDNRTEYSEIEIGVIGDPLQFCESETDDENDTIDCVTINP
ncbi:unnamed protein product [Mytilus edulis]|uniref:Uncharacterized protein n=1 Tax=Mytilus edulis TaxID=6550 RepID=A0A8S3VDT5_MYTED|nr:unnamed protein product [Mytilus edulis]